MRNVQEVAGLRQQQKPAADLPGFERGVSLGGVGERIRCRDTYLDAALVNPGHQLLQIVGIFGYRKAIGAREKQRTFFLQRMRSKGGT